MALNGGYILHIDGTCEGYSPHFFTGMDEISGIILSSVKINSEKREKIVPFLKDIQAKYLLYFTPKKKEKTHGGSQNCLERKSSRKDN